MSQPRGRARVWQGQLRRVPRAQAAAGAQAARCGLPRAAAPTKASVSSQRRATAAPHARAGGATRRETTTQLQRARCHAVRSARRAGATRGQLRFAPRLPRAQTRRPPSAACCAPWARRPSCLRDALRLSPARPWSAGSLCIAPLASAVAWRPGLDARAAPAARGVCGAMLLPARAPARVPAALAGRRAWRSRCGRLRCSARRAERSEGAWPPVCGVAYAMVAAGMPHATRHHPLSPALGVRAGVEVSRRRVDVRLPLSDDDAAALRRRVPVRAARARPARMPRRRLRRWSSRAPRACKLTRAGVAGPGPRRHAQPRPPRGVARRLPLRRVRWLLRSLCAPTRLRCRTPFARRPRRAPPCSCRCRPRCATRRTRCPAVSWRWLLRWR